MGKTTAPTPDQPGRWVVSRFGPPSVLEWRAFDPLPRPTGDEVLVAILVAGISGTDNLQRVGGHPDPRVAQPGFAPGHDFVGEIVALGPAVPTTRGLAVGDRVAALCMCGAYATHIVLPAAELLKLRATDDPVRFAALPLNYMTAYGMLKRSAAAVPLFETAPGDSDSGRSILIGSVAGGIGTAVAQLVHAFDLRLTMFGTCSPGKFGYVRALGVTPIDRHSGDVARQVRALTGGAGVDVAFDAVGSEASLRESWAATKAGTGVLVGVGAMAGIAADGSGLRPGSFNTVQFLRDGVLPRSSFFAMTLSYYAGARDVWLQDFEDVAQAVRDGRLDPAIGQLLPLREAVRANEMLVAGAGVTGKLEFVVDAELAKTKGVIV